MEVWGGIECTINRVEDHYIDQLEYSGHYKREEDLNLVAGLGIKKVRYPVLWEKHQPEKEKKIDWSFAMTRLNQLKHLNIDPIIGLVHHGSGPAYVNILEESFTEGLAMYAEKVAAQFPWINYYTPVNEPLTTARFCGLYGLWYPHGKNDRQFVRILLNECKATVLAMRAIRKINPLAKLVQTEDMGRTHSSPKLRYQARFENKRRWLSFDLLCGKVTTRHPLREYLLNSGASVSDLEFFITNPCPPDLIGINHYLTSERYIDEDLSSFPEHTHGSNGKHRYADVEAVRVGNIKPYGPYRLLKQVWQRYKIPIALTEVHLNCSRDEQLRWFNYVYQDALKLEQEGIAVKAVTAWAILGSFGWNKLLTRPHGDYEPGVFDTSSGIPRPTALSKFIKHTAQDRLYDHPVLKGMGWWQRETRVLYNKFSTKYTKIKESYSCPPILVIGKTGTLGQAFSRICEIRNLHYQIVSRPDLDITDLNMAEQFIKNLKPWAIINAAGFVRVDEAQIEYNDCYKQNTQGAKNLAAISKKHGIKLLTFSTDLVFDGTKNGPYHEDDTPHPLNIYGKSKALAEEQVLKQDPSALVIRTSAFFGPWDKHNFVIKTLQSIKSGAPVTVDKDVFISPTYIPDLAHAALDLMFDDENGIWHLTNGNTLSWAALATEIAKRANADPSLVIPILQRDLGYLAKRPKNSGLTSRYGNFLPSLDNALDRFFLEFGNENMEADNAFLKVV